jgi:NADH:ubiquinone oxidoreductase subunit 3 (subunit A)
MNTLSLWARRSPIQFFGVGMLVFIVIDLLLYIAFGWQFSWKTIASDIGTVMFIQYGFWMWRQYEKKNNVTTTLYKNRKKLEEAA